MRRASLVLAAVLGLLFPAEARPQTTGFTTRAIKEFSNALTNAGRFGVPRYTTVALPVCATTNRGAVAFDTSTLSFKVCTGAAWAAPGGGGASSITMNDDVPLAFGTAADNTRPAIMFNTTQTVDTGMFLTGTVSNHWVIAENQDKTFDFAHAAATDPTLFIHSHNQNTTQFLSLAHNGTNPIIADGANAGVILASGATSVFAAQAAGLVMAPSLLLGWGSANVNSSADAFFKREAAAIIQMGTDVNGAAITQTLKAADGITGTDIIGSGLTLASGLGTGAAVSQPATINRQVTKASGTTAQTYAPAVIACPTKILSNTSATTTTIATITTTSTTGGSVTYDYTVIANNGTLQDIDGGLVKVAWGNNAGTVTSTMTAVAVQADADASGTLAATPTRTDATNVVSIKLTPTWTVIVPTTVIAIATFTVATIGDTVTCQ